MNTTSLLPRAEPTLEDASQALFQEAEKIHEGGGRDAIDRQHAKGRMTARERIAMLLDADAAFLELGLWAAHGMYAEWGGAPSAGVITGIGVVSHRRVMIVANDATVKAGAFFPMTIKKVLRAQRIAAENRLPLLYLVDSSGVFLPMQDEVFPDDDDFGRIFRNNAVISAQGIPQLAAIMGNCVAGGAYLPVLCDTVLMTEGSGLYLAGPALVKAAIGQDVSHEDLGGAHMHAAISGTIDYREPNDEACLRRLRNLVSHLPPDPPFASTTIVKAPSRPPQDLYRIVKSDPSAQYDMRDLIATLVDGDSFDEYRAEYGQTLVCGFARFGGIGVGIVGNQRLRIQPSKGGPYQFGGVIYADSADKAARFVMECNQSRVPLLFLQDVNGFDVGRDAERSGIIRSGAKLVSAVSNSVVPKITLLVGHSFGAGHYALGGKAFDPRFLFAWPGARYAVMGGPQAAKTMLDVNLATLKRQGKQVDAAEMDAIAADLRARYDRETDIRYAAARGWVDAILDPLQTREILISAFDVTTRVRETRGFPLGVFQVNRAGKGGMMAASQQNPIRIANGAGFWGDNLDAPVALVESGQIDVLTLEYLAELTLAILAHQRAKDPNAGFVADFPDLLARLGSRPLPLIVTNAGGLNPRACAIASSRILTKNGHAEIPVATLQGDDVLPSLPRWLAQGVELPHMETGEPMSRILPLLVSANAYLGAGCIAQSRNQGAKIVITGRVADASLTLGPAVAHFGWAMEDLPRLAGASVAGHLIECGAQATGGLWHRWDEIPDFANVGYPIAEISADGSSIITKPSGSGGMVTVPNIAEQLVYEIDDPKCYRTPDVDVDLTTVKLAQAGPNRVSVTGASGRSASNKLKIAAVYRDGWTASGMVAVIGQRAVAKARAAGRLVLDRVKRAGFEMEDSLVECLGAGDLVPGVIPPSFEPYEVVLRVTVRDPRRAAVERFCREIAPLITAGPPGIAGYASGRPSARPAFNYWPTLVDRSLVQAGFEVRTASEWAKETCS